jgi:hypothetical protein
MAESGAAFTLTGAGARALFCTLAGLTYRQLCGLVQRPSETGAVIAHIGRHRSGTRPIPKPSTTRSTSDGRSCYLQA